MDRVTVFNGLKYSLGFRGDLVDLYSLNPGKYNDVIGIDKSSLKNAYTKRVWVRVRNCSALYLGVSEGNILLDVRPSKDVEILGAKEVDRGVYHAEIPIIEVEKIWEERSQYLDFPFPENLEKNVELNIEDLLK